jgi:beta-glucanase (GH16 family)
MDAGRGPVDHRDVVRRASLLAALVVTALAAAAGSAVAATGFSDPFDSLEGGRWSIGEHQLGRSRLDPANAAVAGGALELRHPAGTLDGAEVRTTALWRTGTYRARLRAANAPSSLTGFFLYAPADYASEVDIEILNDASGTVLFSTYAGGRQTHTETRSLGFDPTAALHTYEIELDRRAVTFRVDGVALRSWKNGVPTAPMALYLNSWFPAWLAGTPSPGAATLVDRVEATP